jgi:hypothetical protein
MKSHILALTILLCGIISTHHLLAQRAWRTIGNLQEARNLFGAVPLPSRQILVMGGYSGGRITASCEMINVDARRIQSASMMNTPRAESVFLLNRDSNIVAVSGLSGINGEVTSLCEIYNRTSKQWTILGRLLIARRQHIAFFLNDEEILVVGGRDVTISTLRSAEIFNTRTGQSSIIADFPFPINFGHGAISSQNKPLVLAGRSGGAGSSRSARVFEYDTMQDNWRSVSNIQEGVAAPGFTKLFDGRLMIAGGTRGESPENYSNQVFLEAYPVFQSISQMSVERHWVSMAQWNRDTVMILGGFDNSTTTLASTEWANVQNKSVERGLTMITPRSQFVALSLPEFNAQAQQTKACIVAISGLSSNNINTPTVEILEDTQLRVPPVVLPALPPFPNIASTFTETNDCRVFRLALRTTTGTIQSIELVFFQH